MRAQTFLPMLLAACLAGASGCAMDTLDEDSTGSTTLASHGWGDDPNDPNDEAYHWARTTASFDLVTVSSLTSDWSGYLSQAAADWNAGWVVDGALAYPIVLNFNVVAGDTGKGTRKRCNPDAGQVRVCNSSYGNTGWLGIAGINIDQGGHIVSGYTKVNDTYFGGGFYNDPVWKQGVMCQEIGHDIGLGHQDEDFNNSPLFSCMDYQDPIHETPNGHDFEQLADMYAHTDSYDSYTAGGGGGGDGGDGGGCNAPPGKGCNKQGLPGWWGQSVAKSGNIERFERINADGSMRVTTVTWVD